MPLTGCAAEDRPFTDVKYLHLDDTILAPDTIGRKARNDAMETYCKLTPGMMIPFDQLPCPSTSWELMTTVRGRQFNYWTGPFNTESLFKLALDALAFTFPTTREETEVYLPYMSPDLYNQHYQRYTFHVDVLLKRPYYNAQGRIACERPYMWDKFASTPSALEHQSQYEKYQVRVRYTHLASRAAYYECYDVNWDARPLLKQSSDSE